MLNGQESNQAPQAHKPRGFTHAQKTTARRTTTRDIHAPSGPNESPHPNMANKDFHDYDTFVEKFKPKKTTDDCYTPPNVYEATLAWVRENFDDIPDDPALILRPFKPGGDYKRENYPPGSVVVDNPPFSILAEITKWYAAKGVRFFLFAPHLTLFSRRPGPCGYVVCGLGIVYENGANVATSFIHNLGGSFIDTAPGLYAALNEANEANIRKLRKQLPTYEYPTQMLTATRLAFLAQHGVRLNLDRAEVHRITRLESQRKKQKTVFGGGFLMSSSATDRYSEAENQARENRTKNTWKLTFKEQHIINQLDARTNPTPETNSAPRPHTPRPTSH